jgi:hypothetical protein
MRPRDEAGLPVVGSTGEDELDHHAELTRRTNYPCQVATKGDLDIGNYGTIYVSSIWPKRGIDQINSVHCANDRISLLYESLPLLTEPIKNEFTMNFRSR